MKIKEGFIIRPVLDSFVVMPIGAAVVDFNGMLRLNASGAFLWHKLETGATLETLADALVAEYGIAPEIARQDARDFTEMLGKAGCLITE